MNLYLLLIFDQASIILLFAISIGCIIFGAIDFFQVQEKRKESTLHLGIGGIFLVLGLRAVLNDRIIYSGYVVIALLLAFLVICILIVIIGIISMRASISDNSKRTRKRVNRAIIK